MSEAWGDLSWLRMYAEGLTDAKQNRVSTVNRIERGGTADKLHGGLIIDASWELERQCEAHLMQEYERVVPDRVRQWAASIPCLATGELFPRILGAIGHPRIATPEKWDGPVVVPDGEPYERTLRQLWQYCGCGDPERVPPKNATREELLACGKRTVIRPLLYTFTSTLAKKAAVVTKEGSKHFGLPMSQAAADSEFWKVFTKAKADAAGHAGNCDKWPGPCRETHRRHVHSCVNHKRPPFAPDGCGTVAHPEWGVIGSPWRPMHILMHAHRVAQKEFLRRLWVVSEEKDTGVMR